MGACGSYESNGLSTRCECFNIVQVIWYFMLIFPSRVYSGASKAEKPETSKFLIDKSEFRPDSPKPQSQPLERETIDLTEREPDCEHGRGEAGAHETQAGGSGLDSN